MAFTIRPSCEPPTAFELQQAVLALGINFDPLWSGREMIAAIVKNLTDNAATYWDSIYCVIDNDRELVLIGGTLFARDIL